MSEVTSEDYFGTLYHKGSQKWISYYKQHYFGSFPTALEAALAYDEKIHEINENVPLNFPRIGVIDTQSTTLARGKTNESVNSEVKMHDIYHKNIKDHIKRANYSNIQSDQTKLNQPPMFGSMIMRKDQQLVHGESSKVGDSQGKAHSGNHDAAASNEKARFENEVLVSGADLNSQQMLMVEEYGSSQDMAQELAPYPKTIVVSNNQQVNCLKCTFLNRKRATKCQVCGSKLPALKSRPSKKRRVKEMDDFASSIDLTLNSSPSQMNGEDTTASVLTLKKGSKPPKKRRAKEMNHSASSTTLNSSLSQMNGEVTSSVSKEVELHPDFDNITKYPRLVESGQSLQRFSYSLAQLLLQAWEKEEAEMSQPNNNVLQLEPSVIFGETNHQKFNSDETAYSESSSMILSPLNSPVLDPIAPNNNAIKDEGTPHEEEVASKSLNVRISTENNTNGDPDSQESVLSIFGVFADQNNAVDQQTDIDDFMNSLSISPTIPSFETFDCSTIKATSTRAMDDTLKSTKVVNSPEVEYQIPLINNVHVEKKEEDFVADSMSSTEFNYTEKEAFFSSKEINQERNSLNPETDPPKELSPQTSESRKLPFPAMEGEWLAEDDGQMKTILQENNRSQVGGGFASTSTNPKTSASDPTSTESVEGTEEKDEEQGSEVTVQEDMSLSLLTSRDDCCFHSNADSCVQSLLELSQTNRAHKSVFDTSQATEGFSMSSDANNDSSKVCSENPQTEFFTNNLFLDKEILPPQHISAQNEATELVGEGHEEVVENLPQEVGFILPKTSPVQTETIESDESDESGNLPQENHILPKTSAVQTEPTESDGGNVFENLTQETSFILPKNSLVQVKPAEDEGDYNRLPAQEVCLINDNNLLIDKENGFSIPKTGTTESEEEVVENLSKKDVYSQNLSKEKKAQCEAEVIINLPTSTTTTRRPLRAQLHKDVPKELSCIPVDIQHRLMDVVWVKFNPHFNSWWPGIVYHGRGIAEDVKTQYLKSIDSKHLIYYYGSGNFGIIDFKNVRPFTSGTQPSEPAFTKLPGKKGKKPPRVMGAKMELAHKNGILLAIKEFKIQNKWNRVKWLKN